VATKRNKSTSGKASSRGSGSGAPPPGPAPIVFKENDEQAARYSYLRRREIFPTRYLDEPSLITLGLLEDVEYMLNNVGWSKFATMKYDTYELITLEFLSSVNIIYLEG